MAPLHVGLNLVFLVPGETGGMEVYARELIPRLAAREDLRLTAFTSRAAAEGLDELGVPVEVLPVDARSRVQWVRGEQQHLPGAAARAGCDVVHSLASTAPWRGPFRRVTTIHDLHYKLVPDAHFGVRGLGMRVLVPGAARFSHRIVVDAASTREDLREHLHVPTAKVDVVPLGVGTTAHVAPTPTVALRDRLELGERAVVLSVSAKRPHKNLMRLIEALPALDPRPVLVLPGYATEHEAALRARAAALGVTDDVRFLDWVGAADLEGLYALAAVVAFPSLYEGFGLPVLEAMARGVPVVTSGRASLAEVAGDAALLVDPERTEDIAGAIGRVLADATLAGRLRAAGHEQAARFTWERTAELTAASYARAVA